jgi:small subunit ribosomal protein S2
MSHISMKELLEAGVHFGHQTKRWNPKMKPYIFAARKGIHIIDLQQTLYYFEKAYEFVEDQAAANKTILFVCTKKQGQDEIREAAITCGMPYVTYKWLGGLLTNFSTVRKGVENFKKLVELEETGEINKYTKKEAKILMKKKEKLEKYLSGIKNMTKLPDVIIAVDTKREELAIEEANKLKIPVVALVDTNCDPDPVDYIIPGNDDAIRSISLLAQKMQEAVLRGRERYNKEAAEKIETEKFEAAVSEKIESEEELIEEEDI